MTLFRSPSTNFWSTTLNGSTTDVATTITLNSVTGLRAPGILIIDRQDSSGNNTPTLREVISFTGVSGSNITGVTRGVSSTTNQSHSSGALVEAVLETSMWDGLISAATVVFDANGVLNSVISPMSVSNLHVSNLALSGTASVTELQGLRGVFSTMTISTMLNASGASILGFSSTTADPLTIGNLILTAGASIATMRVGTHLSGSGASLSLFRNVDTGVEDVLLTAPSEGLNGDFSVYLPIRFGIPFATIPSIAVSIVSGPSVGTISARNATGNGFTIRLPRAPASGGVVYGVFSWKATG